jgi:hypothetical protein
MRRERLSVDQRPGSLPEIRTDDASITFAMSVSGVPRGEHLIIRCDASGEIWIAIASESDADV